MVEKKNGKKGIQKKEEKWFVMAFCDGGIDREKDTSKNYDALEFDGEVGGILSHRIFLFLASTFGEGIRMMVEFRFCIPSPPKELNVDTLGE